MLLGHHTTFFRLACKHAASVYTGYETGTISMKSFLKSAVLLTFGAAAISMAAERAKCDRACLDQTVDAYIAAMVAHNPSQVAFAKDVKFVENTVPMKPGEGLWKTASARPNHVQDLCSRSGGAAGGLFVCDDRRRQTDPVWSALEAGERQDHGGGASDCARSSGTQPQEFADAAGRGCWQRSRPPSERRGRKC